MLCILQAYSLKEVAEAGVANGVVLGEAHSFLWVQSRCLVLVHLKEFAPALSNDGLLSPSVGEYRSTKGVFCNFSLLFWLSNFILVVLQLLAIEFL